MTTPTSISIMDDGYNFVSQPVMGVYALYQKPAVEPAPLGTVDPTPVEDEDADAKAAQAEVDAKVVTNPGKSAAAKAADVSASVETK